MRAVGTKIPDDVYEKLKERARELGYASVSSLLRDMIYQFLGLESEGKKVNPVTINYNPDEILERLNRIEERLSQVEKRLDRMEGLNRWLGTGSTRPRKR